MPLHKNHIYSLCEIHGPPWGNDFSYFWPTQTHLYILFQKEFTPYSIFSPLNTLLKFWARKGNHISSSDLSQQFVIFRALMSCMDVSFQMSSFVTNLTFVIFVAIMNCVDVPLQIFYLRKWFAAMKAFVIFVAFVNCMNVFLHIFCIRKWFTARFTLIVIPSMNSFDMNS